MKNNNFAQHTIILCIYVLLIWIILISTMKMYPHTNPEKQDILLKNKNTDVLKPE